MQTVRLFSGKLHNTSTEIMKIYSTQAFHLLFETSCIWLIISAGYMVLEIVGLSVQHFLDEKTMQLQ